jgi:hypothetical protein
MKNHKWIYRNPADRTCGVCGERHVTWMNVYQDGRGKEYIHNEWWEVAYPLVAPNTLCDFTFLGWVASLLPRREKAK